VAVVVLFFFHFQEKKLMNEPATQNMKTSENVFNEVAFVNTDTLLKYYSLTDVLFKQLETKRSKLENEYRNRQQGLQQEIEDYQRNQPNLTIGQARSIEDDLVKKQQNLQQYQQSLTDELMREQNRINTQLYDNVSEFLGNYGSQNNLKMVLTFTKGNPNLLYAHDSLDITPVVIEGLNKKYEASKILQKQDSVKRK